MAFGSSLLLPARRFAAGVDVSQQALRLVVLSRRSRAGGGVRLEHVGEVPLASSAMAGADVVDRTAVSRALRHLYAGLPSRCAAQTMSCAMGLPASAIATTTVPLAQFGGGMRATSRRAHAVLEPAVMIEAERIAGIERHALAVDWFVEDAAHNAQDEGHVTIAAAGRAHLEARVECAASAGISLTALDGEPHAALRALRYAATCELAPNEPYVALWVGTESVHGWLIAGEAMAGEIRYPAPGYAGFADALRDLVRENAPGCALVGGELELLDGIGFSIADIGDVLGCTVLPFECVTFGDGIAAQAIELLHEPAYAVAFGLALRGVFE
ncbi:pilus assembly protein PilM [Paraburkholderia sp.]|uniref:pilus assembly protein PilM n=1 Tax=Paraburkholderia sp. TaxID=1926495 RepID=UPI003D6EE587